MSNIYNLLNINKSSITDFQIQASLIDEHQLEKKINSHIKKLKDIRERMLVDECPKIQELAVENVINKVIKSSSQNDNSLDFHYHFILYN